MDMNPHDAAMANTYTVKSSQFFDNSNAGVRLILEVGDVVAASRYFHK
jgi:hypothetical protein